MIPYTQYLKEEKIPPRLIRNSVFLPGLMRPPASH